MPRKRLIVYSVILSVFFLLLSCRESVESVEIPTLVFHPITSITVTPTVTDNPTKVSLLPMVRNPGDPTIVSPTPDVPHELPEIRTEEERYIVQLGDSLGVIATRYNVTVQMLIDANQIINPNLLEVGQELIVPAPTPGDKGSDFKIIPDSELVYGPYASNLDVNAFTSRYDSYLNRYSEVVEGRLLTGPEIVQMIAQDYSVNPRLLLAVLEYQSGWVTKANPSEDARYFPIGIRDSWRVGLYLQLSWAANNLNRGFYQWRLDGNSGWLLDSGMIIPTDPSINAATAAVQQLFALLYDRKGWDKAVSPVGLYATYSGFFGYPFDYAFEPLIPDNLEQPILQLPFEPGIYWAFTGGPHGGWGDGSAWAAIDFAPGVNGLGCMQSNLWVVAVADGMVIRADQGRVIQDLDGDGNEGTGWVVLYMHIEGRDRIQAGEYIHAGDRIGHPSCEGGYSTGTHFHLARRYNGEWISADQTTTNNGIPFNLDGWISSGAGIEYNGTLKRDGKTIQAWEGFSPGNAIHR